jgi:hypothetical protein
MERLHERVQQGFNRAKNGKLLSSASALICFFLIFFNLAGSVGPFLSAKYFGGFKNALKRLGEELSRASETACRKGNAGHLNRKDLRHRAKRVRFGAEVYLQPPN